jgi:thiamine biosynthesis lipoprotein
MTKVLKLIACLVLMSALPACSQPETAINKFEGMAQGTTYHISYWTPIPIDEKALETAVLNEFAAIDKALSNYRSDSVIEEFNHNPSSESQELGVEIVGLFKLAQGVSQSSQGCYDLTIKPLFDLWGFMGESLTIPNPDALQQALAQVGMDKVKVVDATHLQKPVAVRVDLSSIAQGYSVGKISQVLETFGVGNYLVEIGGELKANGHKPNGHSWRIAVEKPLPGEQKMQKIVTLPLDSPMSVMTSGTYRHYFDVNGQRYSHILDARTGKPVTHDLVAVTVLNENPAVADAWSTALICVGQQQAMEMANAAKISALFIQQQGDKLLETKSDALISSGLSLE